MKANEDLANADMKKDARRKSEAICYSRMQENQIGFFLDNLLATQAYEASFSTDLVGGRKNPSARKARETSCENIDHSLVPPAPN